MAEKRKKFKYRGYGDEEVKKAANAKSSDFDSFLKSDYPFFKPRSGENNIRILPAAWEDTETWGSYWGIEIGVHYGIGADNSTYLCLKTGNHAEDCPMCTAASEAENDKERAALRMKKRELCLVIDRDNEKLGPQIWAMPLTLSKEISQRIAKVRKDGGGDIKIDNPDEGYDVSFNKEGEKDKTKYTTVEIARSSSALHDNEKRAQRWLDLITDKPAPDQLEFHEEEYIEKILAGGSSKRRDDEDDDDEDDKKSKGKAKKPAKGKSKKDDDDDEPEDDDEAEEEADDEDDDDDDDKGKGKKKPKAKSKKSDDDDDDDDDDDAEESEEEDDDGDDDDDDDKAKSKKSKGKDKAKSKKSKSDEDEDEPEEDDDEGEEESEDDDDEDDKAKSKKSKGKPAKKGKSDDDDDDDDDDEEEVEVEDEEDDDEEDKPKKGGKSSATSRAKARLEKLKKRRGGR